MKRRVKIRADRSWELSAHIVQLCAQLICLPSRPGAGRRHTVVESGGRSSPLNNRHRRPLQIFENRRITSCLPGEAGIAEAFAGEM